VLRTARIILITFCMVNSKNCLFRGCYQTPVTDAFTRHSRCSYRATSYGFGRGIGKCIDLSM